MLTHIDLFSGIGGFALAAEWAGFETVVFCEKDEYCQKVLRKRFPGVPIVPEIRDFRWPMADTKFIRWGEREHTSTNRDEKEIALLCQATLLTGGFPCQPFSVAGKRRGKEDDRYLWPEMFAVISQVRPTWVIAENVAGIIKMELDNCLSDLESEGYETETFTIPACAVDAKHQRKRVWIVAYDKGGKSGESEARNRGESACGRSQDVADTEGILPQGFGNGQEQRESRGEGRWPVEPDVGRVAHGVPSRVDRLKCLGNAIVPQVAYEIMRAIKEIEV